MTSSERDLQEMRERIATDPRARQQFIANLGDVLETAEPASAEAAPGPIGQLMAEVNSAETPTRRQELLESLIATGALLWAPPALARILLTVPGSGCSILVVVIC